MTKTCEGCGWVYPINYPELRCRFCGTKFKKRFCLACGEYTEMVPRRQICKKCNSLRCHDKKYDDGRFYRRYLQEANKQFDDWISLIQAVPKPYKTLTEDEWINACRYFGKCALCRNEGIDARAYFIAYQLGGKYTAWNVIPVCEKCATSLKIQQNPFIKYNNKVSSALARDSAGILDNITAYLKPIILEAIKNGPSTSQSSIQDFYE